MLGLPDGVTACLFDLDGVLTETAAVHAAAWKEMFDDFLRRRAERDGEPFVPFDPATTTTRYVDGKPRADGVRDFLASRGHRAARGHARRPARRRDGARPRQPQERARAAHDPRATASRSTRARVRYLQAARDAGLRRAVVSSSANSARRARGRPASRDLFEAARRRRRRRASSGLPGKPAPDTFLARPPSARRRARGRPRSSRTRWPGVEAGRAGDFGCVVGVDRVGQAEALRRARRRRRRRRTSPSCW